MRLPFISRRHDAELESARDETERMREQRDKANKDCAAFKYAAESAAEKYTDTCIVNECLTADLAKAKARLAEYGDRRTVSDVLEEHDVHRKAIADALGDQKRHLNWNQLIAEVERLGGVCEAWMADHKAQRDRADRLEAELATVREQTADGAAAEWRARATAAEKSVKQLQKQYDDATGLNTGRGDRGLHGSEHWKPPVPLDVKPKGAVS